MKKVHFTIPPKGTRMQRLLITVVMFVTITFTIFIQISCNRNRNDEQINIEAKRNVLAIDDRRTDALRQNNPEPLRQIYADDYTLVTPSGVIRSKDDQINELKLGRLRYESIETMTRTVRVYGDVAIVLSREKYDIVQDGKHLGGDIFFTRTYKNFGKEWRVIATHGSFAKQ